MTYWIQLEKCALTFLCGTKLHVLKYTECTRYDGHAPAIEQQPHNLAFVLKTFFCLVYSSSDLKGEINRGKWLSPLSSHQ